MTTCSRRDCNKTLRKDNAKGVCSSNCLSPEAPDNVRAKGVDSTASVVEERTEKASTPAPPASAARFLAVHDAMGMDPEKTLEEFYSSWLEGIRQALES